MWGQIQQLNQLILHVIILEIKPDYAKNWKEVHTEILTVVPFKQWCFFNNNCSLYLEESSHY